MVFYNPAMWWYQHSAQQYRHGCRVSSNIGTGAEFPAISAIAVLAKLDRCVTDLLIHEIWVLFPDLGLHKVWTEMCTTRKYSVRVPYIDNLQMDSGFQKNWAGDHEEGYYPPRRWHGGFWRQFYLSHPMLSIYPLNLKETVLVVIWFLPFFYCE